MDCSDGAKMLIDQMKQHPEEFRGYAGKFTSMLDMARDAEQGALRNVKMSTRDAEAILAAAETHLYEVWLAEDVLTTIMQPKEEVNRAPHKLGVWQGAVPPGSVITTNIASNTATSQYIEQAYQMERAKYQMELEKLRQRDNEHAMRLTKPFTNFL
jgi:hypothetical protein